MIRNIWRLEAWLLLLVINVLSIIGCGTGEAELSDATKHFLSAQDAITNGDQDLAMEELSLSLELEPDAWAYFERAKIHSERGDDDAARSDCEAGLKLDPNHQHLKWLAKELKKPDKQRFRGRTAQPPTSSK